VILTCKENIEKNIYLYMLCYFTETAHVKKKLSREKYFNNKNIEKKV
jgi:hypothetical protein